MLGLVPRTQAVCNAAVSSVRPRCATYVVVSGIWIERQSEEHVVDMVDLLHARQSAVLGLQQSRVVHRR